jgi:D-3-phosphoglycerate dehydrogenase
MTYHILIPDNLDEAGLDLLRTVPDFRLTVGPLNREATLAAVPDADALIVRSSTKVDAAMIAAAPRLKAVARAGVGVDNIDLEAAAARGIVVMNAPDGNTVAAAELTLALMLALVRHISPAHQSLRDGRWDRKKFEGTELRGKVLGLVGLGRIGQAVAMRAQAFGMTTIGYDPKKGPEVFARVNTTFVPLEELFARSDIISLHAPANASTRGMINAQTIALMKDGVRIINTARGVLIDDAALAEALCSGKVAGAALDVYAEEPPPADHPLIGLPNVIATPHLGASTAEAQIAVSVQAAQEIRDFLLRGEVSNAVNGARKLQPAGA